MEFRKLKADEIDVRIGTAKESGVSLLLYKDARVDQNILDETIGAENWQRDHKEIKGSVYCGVGIYNEKLNQFVWKWDVGSESYSEAVKGEASDSFKRACFNWGIGRELYTSPFIWVNANDLKTLKTTGNKTSCYDNFKVTDIDYDKNGNICKLGIKNTTTSKVVFIMGKQVEQSKPIKEPKQQQSKQQQVAEALKHSYLQAEDIIAWLSLRNKIKVNDLTDDELQELLKAINEKQLDDTITEVEI